MGKASNNKRGGDNRYKWTQMLLSPVVHKRLRQLALERDVTLKELLEDIIKTYLNKENSHGRSTSKGSTKESQEAY